VRTLSNTPQAGFEDSLSRTADRLATLLLTLALVSFVAWVTCRNAARETSSSQPQH
jgi:hypothetical protein